MTISCSFISPTRGLLLASGAEEEIREDVGDAPARAPGENEGGDF